ncbi:hypothetical protein MXM72_22255 [Enterobacter roggenkampii]|uniref:sodium:calcium antiporter n=1 Tax=Enterobacter roggenkampii TaxID=1812935 RepID=UPI002DBCA824|nr:hypothetical protein [Enterobacter roggenkampii]MEB6514818.1 hypothetical protein [Enterobacter roggenkampii]
MMSSIAELLFSLVIILIAAEFFTNALEHLGQKLRLSQGVTGSILAAVGTALPETIIPLLAIITGPTLSNHSEEIGVGAILGAPLMLSTLSVFLMGLAIIDKRGLRGEICPEPGGFRRDTGFFLIAFTFASLAMFIPHNMSQCRQIISLMLVILYFLYVYRTIKASRHLVQEGTGTEAQQSLYISRVVRSENLPVILLQVILSISILLAGAFWFIRGVESASEYFGISALLLSLIIIPIATELPEKINSILWIRRGKDTLAVGNITGAMVFQGTLLPAIGITLTPWEPRSEVLTGIVITLVAALWLFCGARRRRMPVSWLGLNGLLYVLYICISLYNR